MLMDFIRVMQSEPMAWRIFTYGIALCIFAVLLGTLLAWAEIWLGER